jgi:pimeloyl-ACP methyl ester carboxylesterase
MRIASLALALIASSAQGQAPAPADISAYVRPQQRIEIAPGRGLNLVCMGSGERTLLFDAGGSDWSVIWALVQPELARHARACAYDRAGLGYSDAARGARSPIAIVEDLHALLAAAALKRPVVLVGHSLGGFNMKLYAALYPEDVAGLVLVDPAEERSWERSRALVTRRYGRALAAKAELLDLSFFTGLVERYRSCSAAAADAPLDPASLTYRRCTDPVRPQLGPAITAERQRLQVSPGYQKAQASEIVDSVYGDTSSDRAYAALFRAEMFGNRPMIVLTHGRFDAEDPLDALGQMQGIALHRESARLSRKGSHRIVEGSGHNIPVEQPAAVIDAVLQVLDQLDHRGPRRK